MKYVAFLRGINIGGHKKVPMAELRELLGSLGFEDVKTLLASGNAVFDAPETDPSQLKAQIEAGIEEMFGFSANVIIRTFAHIEQLLDIEPFAGIEAAKDTLLYVSFLPQPPADKLKTPHIAAEGNFQVINVTDTEVFSVLMLTKSSRSVDAMKVLEQQFGRDITTRNWNTIVQLAAL